MKPTPHYDPSLVLHRTTHAIMVSRRAGAAPAVPCCASGRQATGLPYGFQWTACGATDKRIGARFIRLSVSYPLEGSPT